VVQSHLLLHVVDIANAEAEEQIEAVQETIRELGVADKPVIHVLNKIDLLENGPHVLQSFRHRLGHVVGVSAETGDGIEELTTMIAEMLGEFWVRVRLSVPADQQALISLLHSQGKIYRKEYQDGRVQLEVEVPKKLAERVRQYSLS